MYLLQKITLLFLSLIVLSCDGVVSQRGRVLDDRTCDPIQDATILFEKKEYKTDKDGSFNIDYVALAPPSDYELTVTKDQYRPAHIILDSDGDEELYRVTRRADKVRYSNNFKIQNDSIIFYLRHVNDVLSR